MAVLLDSGGRVTRVAHKYFLGRDRDVDSAFERLNVELAVFASELHKVQRSKVARRVIKVHVLAAGIGGIDARRSG